MKGDDGEWYAVHEGEWVEMLPRRTFAEIREFQRFRKLSADLDALRPAPGDDSTEAMQALIAMRDTQSAAFLELCEYLAARVVRWTWTGPLGAPLVPWNDEYEDPETHERKACARITGDVRAIERLDAGEIYYLLDVKQGEPPAEKKDFLADSATTSSASTPAATEEPSSTSAPSLTRVK